MTRDKAEKLLRDLLLRSRLAEIAELAKSDPLYGISPEAAIKRAAARVAEKHGLPAGEKERGRK